MLIRREDREGTQPILVVFDQRNGRKLFRGRVLPVKLSSFRPLSAFWQADKRYLIERVFMVAARTGIVFTFVGARPEPVPASEPAPRPFVSGDFLPPPRRRGSHLQLVP